MGKLIARQASMQALAHDYNQASLLYAESLDILRRHDARQELLFVLREQGNLAIFTGAFAEAPPCFRANLALAQEYGDEQGVMYALSQLGWAHMKLGDIEAALQSMQASLALFHTRGAPSGMLWIIKDLGDIALWQGKYAEARNHYQEAFALAQELRYPLASAYAQIGLAGVHLDLGEYPMAKQHYSAAAIIYQTLEEPRRTDYPLCMLAYVALLMDDLAAAEAYLAQSRTWCIAKGVNQDLYWCCRVRGELALAQGDYPQAERHFQRAIAAFADIDDTGIPWGMAWAYNGLGRLACAQGVYQQAWAHFTQALRSALAAPSVPEALDILIGMATVLARQGKLYQALELLAHPLNQPSRRQRSALHAHYLLVELQQTLPVEEVAALLNKKPRSVTRRGSEQRTSSRSRNNLGSHLTQ